MPFSSVHFLSSPSVPANVFAVNLRHCGSDLPSISPSVGSFEAVSAMTQLRFVYLSIVRSGRKLCGTSTKPEAAFALARACGSIELLVAVAVAFVFELELLDAAAAMLSG